MGDFRFGERKSFNGHRGGGRSFGGGRSRGDRSRGGDRPMMHDAVCSQCDSPCQVPFMPTGSKPVYCDRCFKKNDNFSRNDSGRRDFDRRDFGKKNFSSDKPRADFSVYEKRLSAIETKIDLILSLLQPVEVAEPKKAKKSKKK